MGNTLLDGGLAGDLGGGLGGGLRGGDGLGGSRLGGGLGGGLPRSPMMGRGVYGARGPSSLDPRMPYMEDDLGGRRRGSLLRNGLGVPSAGSQERLVAGRAAMMGGGMRDALGGGLGGVGMGGAMGGRMAAGIGSPLGSPAGSIFDPYRMDRPRMPYGPAAQAAMGNYRSPYVEDYESEIEAEMMDRAMMEREFMGTGDGYYGYGAGNPMGGHYGPI